MGARVVRDTWYKRGCKQVRTAENTDLRRDVCVCVCILVKLLCITQCFTYENFSKICIVQQCLVKQTFFFFLNEGVSEMLNPTFMSE